eukprot:9044323-Lingulodinium_polyedra.AAC.1
MPESGSREAEVVRNGGRGAAVQTRRACASRRHAAPVQPAEAEAWRKRGLRAQRHVGQARPG